MTTLHAIHLDLTVLSSILYIFDLIQQSTTVLKIIYIQNYHKLQNKVYANLLCNTAHKLKKVQIYYTISATFFTFLTFNKLLKCSYFFSLIICKNQSLTKELNYNSYLKIKISGTEILLKYCFNGDIYYCFKIIKFQFLPKEYG